MRKIFTVLMLLMALMFTQCKPDNGNDGDVRKVKVTCEIPINNDGLRSDFGKLMTDGSIMWSVGTERVYLALTDPTNPQIVELVADEHTMKANILAFEGEVDMDLVEEGKEYEVWYFGNSKTYGTPSYTETKEGVMIKSISGNIASQSGNLSDLGQYHIAKTTVTAKFEDGEIVLPLRGMLKNIVAIAHLDLEGVTTLRGDAIVGTEYTYQYNAGSGQFEFVVRNVPSASINIANGSATSYVMLLPNATNNVQLECKKGTYTFKNAVESNKFYFKYLDAYVIVPLEWVSSGGGGGGEINYNGHEYVDLGLPSGLKWATCNVGANTPEAFGDYYKWGALETFSVTGMNSPFSGVSASDISGDPAYDIARVAMGGDWRMPTLDEMQELVDECDWTQTIQNDVDGWIVKGSNGNSIFIPGAGYEYVGGVGAGFYWTSTPDVSTISDAYYLWLNGVDVRQIPSNGNREYGHSIRAVAGN